MSKTISQVDVAANATFQTLIDTVNLLANVVSTEVVTANSAVGGASTTGNGFVNGVFGSNTLVTSTLRGGNLSSSANLTISTNAALSDVLTVNTYVFVGNSTVNAFVNGSFIKLANSTASVNVSPISITVGPTVINTTTIALGSNATYNTSAILLGNSTVNALVNTSVVRIAETTLSNNVLTFGNSTVNATINSIYHGMGNTVVNTTTFTTGNSTVNSTLTQSSLIVGSTTVVNTSIIYLGNSTSNVIVNSTSVSIGSNVGISTSQVGIGNSTVNSVLTSTSLVLGNSTVNSVVNTSAMKVGSNVVLTTSQLSVGNSTVNSVVNSTSLAIGSSGLLANSTAVTLGNVAINTTAVAINGVTLGTNNSISVANNRTTIGTRPTINFSGSGITVDVTDEVSNNLVTVNFTANGGLSIGGSNTFVQFNDQGGLGGLAALTFDKTSNTLSVANIVSVPVILSSGISRTEAKSVAISTGTNTLDVIYFTDHRSAEYLVSIKDNAANGYQVSKLLVLHDGTNGYITEYGSLTTNTAIATFDVSSNSTAVLVRLISSTSNATAKFAKTLIVV